MFKCLRIEFSYQQGLYFGYYSQLLKKCKESGQKFVISKFTRIEFFNTIEYHLQQLNTSTPFGQISPRTFRRYANGDGFYQFYHEWRDGRINYGFDIFKTHIHTLGRSPARNSSSCRLWASYNSSAG